MAQDLLVNYDNKPSYFIRIRLGFDSLGDSIKSDINKKYDKICIITDSNVSKLYLDDVTTQCKKVCDNVCSYTFNAGEASKNLDTAMKIYEYLILNKFTRSSLLVALGGGVVGDMTGFVASTYLRGVDFIQVPTTLLSQVDSSIGGKTGVDFNSYKNMVGAFYMPKLVYMNLSTLNSIDDYNFACGMGEVIKSALIQNKDFYSWLKTNVSKIMTKDYSSLEYLVFECCKIKAFVVEIDPKEQNIRAYLNFGHTLGHAIEKLSDFNLGHGQCVGLGMVCAAFLSNKLGKISNEEYKDIIKTISMFNLPIEYSGIDAKAVLEASKSDKKMVGNKVKFTILESIGKASSYFDFTDTDLLEAIHEVIK